MINIGDIYLVNIYFKGFSGNYKTRPVLIINNDNSQSICTIAEITSKPPKSPPSYYDQFKEKIIFWQECGLNKQSYVKCNNIHNIDPSRLLKKIGSMKPEEFSRIANAIIKANS